MFLKTLLSKFRARGIRFRLTVLFVTLFGSTLIGLSFFLYEWFYESHLTEFDAALYNYAVDVTESITIGRLSDLDDSHAVQFDGGRIFPFPLGTTLILIRRIDGTILDHKGNFGHFVPAFEDDFNLLLNGKESVLRTITHARDKFPDAESDRYRLVSFVIDDSPSPNFVLQIAVPMTWLDRQTIRIKTIFMIAIPLVLLASTLAGLYLSSRALHPVALMIHKAQAIAPNQLQDRLPVPRARDEVQELAITLNQMLDRIEAAYRSQERFVADASHQLLTPLSILKGELETLNKSQPEDVRRFLESSAQEIDALAKLVMQMLMLAKVDAGVGYLNLEKQIFPELILEVVSKIAKVASPKGVKIRFDLAPELVTSDMPLTLICDKDMIQNLLFNVIENAVKYAPADSVVQIRLHADSLKYHLSVQDQGPGISPQEMPRLFERFHRASNSSEYVGYGLGLAIAHKIAQLHQGVLSVESQAGQGTTFHFEIKKN